MEKFQKAKEERLIKNNKVYYFIYRSKEMRLNEKSNDKEFHPKIGRAPKIDVI